MRNVLVQYKGQPDRIRVIETGTERIRINPSTKLEALDDVHTCNQERNLKPYWLFNDEQKKPKSWKKWRNNQWKEVN